MIVELRKQLGTTSPRAAKRMDIARLQLAATLAKAGQKDAARNIYSRPGLGRRRRNTEEGREDRT